MTSIAPSDDVQSRIDKKRQKVTKKRNTVKEKKIALCEELVDVTSTYIGYLVAAPRLFYIPFCEFVKMETIFYIPAPIQDYIC